MSKRDTSIINHYSAILKNRISDIDNQALEILKRLKDSKFEAYLVGGGVRDLLVNLKPKDFDIATNASPNEVRKKVPYCFIIGRRFKLVHARRGDQIYEIATFRRAAKPEELEIAQDEDRRLIEENFFGNIEEDSFRRDFTVNALFYDPIDQKIVDFCDGLTDIESKTLKMIGEPKIRLLEDPIRALRAIRLSQKLNFTIDTDLKTEIFANRDSLVTTVLPRRREEWIKFFRLPKPDRALTEMYDLNILEILLPSLHKIFNNDNEREIFLSMLAQAKWIGFDFSNTTELFCAIMTAFIEAKGIDQPLEQLSENPELVNFCKDELGIFKVEFATYFQTLQFTSALKKREQYVKKGERRQRSILLHPCFFLALKIGLFSKKITPSEFVFWQTEYEKFSLRTA